MTYRCDDCIAGEHEDCRDPDCRCSCHRDEQTAHQRAREEGAE